MVIGHCELCGKLEKLVNSHIIPKSFFKNTSGQTIYSFHNKPHSLKLNISPIFYPKKCPQGIYDQIVCELCERLFSKADDYIHKFLIGRISRVVNGTFSKYYAYEYYDKELLNYFIISLLWRSHVSTRDEFKHVKLGKYKEILKNYLLGVIDFPSQVEYFFRESETELMMPTPVRREFEGRRIYVISLRKWELIVKVDSRKFAPPFDNISFDNEKFSIMKIRDSETLAYKILKGINYY